MFAPMINTKGELQALLTDTEAFKMAYAIVAKGAYCSYASDARTFSEEGAVCKNTSANWESVQSAMSAIKADMAKKEEELKEALPTFIKFLLKAQAFFR